jgi:hypothetical protein
MSTIGELFARDPRELGYREEAIPAIVARLREARAQFQLGEKAAGNPKKIKEKAATISEAELKELGLI